MARRSGTAAELRRLIEESSSAAPPLAVGPAVRDRRRRLGMTLQALADDSGLSAPFLSQMERGLASPSIVSLMSVAKALGVGIDYFLGTPKPGQFIRRAAEPERLDTGLPVTYVRLSGEHEERKMEALLITVPVGLSAPPAHREGEGFWYVLQGQLEMTVGARTFRLSAGDSAHFDQRHAYSMSNVGDGELRMIWVGTPALF